MNCGKLSLPATQKRKMTRLTKVIKKKIIIIINYTRKLEADDTNSNQHKSNVHTSDFKRVIIDFRSLSQIMYLYDFNPRYQNALVPT
jgi:hypothetical protein